MNTQDSRYFDQLYDRYAKKVFAKCISMLRNVDESEDAVHDIFMKIIVKLSKFNHKSRFSTWLYSITYNHCIDNIRKNKKRGQNLGEEYLLDVAHIDDVEDKFILEIRVERLGVVLNKLSSTDKSLLLMKYLEEMKIKDIAKITERSESAIKMQLLRAKHKLKRIYLNVYKEY